MGIIFFTEILFFTEIQKIEKKCCFYEIKSFEESKKTTLTKLHRFESSNIAQYKFGPRYMVIAIYLPDKLFKKIKYKSELLAQNIGCYNLRLDWFIGSDKYGLRFNEFAFPNFYIPKYFFIPKNHVTASFG